ncbi:hypothetical protein AB6A40_001583 [Gnathostoma spinigerum]|uniref:Recombination activating protein 1 n=1 Tax=Gnathostoma spinigerum TaxID=75299 RepID=A0ABD6E9P7_9BILA
MRPNFGEKSQKNKNDGIQTLRNQKDKNERDSDLRKSKEHWSEVMSTWKICDIFEGAEICPLCHKSFKLIHICVI